MISKTLREDIIKEAKALGIGFKDEGKEWGKALKSEAEAWGDAFRDLLF